MAARSARLSVSSLSKVVWSLIGCPSSKDGRTMLSLAGKSPRRKIGSIRGAMVRKARSTSRVRDRLAAGLQPGQPFRCLKATILGGRKQSPLARACADRRRGPGRRGILYTVPVSRRRLPPDEGANTRILSRINLTINGRIEVRRGIGGKQRTAIPDYEALARITAIRSCKRSVAAAGVAALYRFSMAVTSPCAPAHGFPPRRLRP